MGVGGLGCGPEGRRRGVAWWASPPGLGLGFHCFIFLFYVFYLLYLFLYLGIFEKCNMCPIIYVTPKVSATKDLGNYKSQLIFELNIK